MSITGTPETAPLRVGYPVCDTLGGLFGAFAVTAALLRRERTGEGAFLDVSMLESHAERARLARVELPHRRRRARARWATRT